MNRLIIFFLITLFSITAAISQQFKTHTVKEGETVESIAQFYKIKPRDILRLNPEIKGALKENMILVIAPSLETEDKITSVTIIKPSVTFKKHKVRKRETLYSISNKYDITIDDIKRFNKELYSRELKKGERIRIPKFLKPVLSDTEIDSTSNGLEKYIVKPKQGKWRIAYEHGITIKELEEINPEVEEVLKEGQEIWVPVKAIEEKNAVVDSLYNYYTVKPKEGFFRLKVKLGLEEEEIRSLNPELAEDELLKSGMIIKIPKNTNDNFDVKDGLIVEQFSLIDSIQFEATSNIAIVMPFRLNKVDTDSIKGIQLQLQRNSLLSRSVDFYSGALMAIDSAKQLGLSTNVKVFDSERNTNMISNILANNNFENTDAVIGPFFTEPFNKMAQELQTSNIPVFAPFSKNIQLNSNVFQTLPSDEILYNRMVTYLDKILIDKNVIIIADSLNENTKNRLLIRYPTAKAKVLLNKEFLRLDDLHPLLDFEKENYVIVETRNVSLLANITSVLNSAMRIMIEEEDVKEEKIVAIKMVTTNKNSAFDSNTISNLDLSNLEFKYPSVSRFSPTNSVFSKRYEKKYNALPSKYAVRGFDITMDILLRLAYKKNLFYGTNLISETEYIENKFNYNKQFLGGYVNTATYIACYDNLEIKLVKEEDDL